MRKKLLEQSTIPFMSERKIGLLCAAMVDDDDDDGRNAKFLLACDKTKFYGQQKKAFKEIFGLIFLFSREFI